MRDLLAMASPESLELWDHLGLGYTKSPGHPLLREEVARLYETIPADKVLMAIPEEAIFIAMNVLLRPGDHMVAVFPIYQSLYEVARTMGCEVSSWPLELKNGRWTLDLERLDELLKPNTRLVVINFPNNPTGFLPERSLIEALVETLRRRGIYLFSDEMYRLLEHDEAQRLPALCDLYEKGVSLSGLSKSFGLAGLRTGWLACQDEVMIARSQSLKDYTTICASAPSEILSIIALRAKETILARNLAIVRSNLAAAAAFFTAKPELFEWIPPLAGSTAFPRWLDTEPIDHFCNQIVDQRGVMIVPASMFDVSGGHFRVGLGRVNFTEALGVLADFLERRKPETE